MTEGRVLFSVSDVLKKLRISRTSLHRLREKDQLFPKPIKDGTAPYCPHLLHATRN